MGHPIYATSKTSLLEERWHWRPYVDELQTYINEHVAALVERGELLDVYALAQTIQAVFPQHSLPQVAQLVSAAVVALRGNAEWLKNGK
jgi:hypothetical protein